MNCSESQSSTPSKVSGLIIESRSQKRFDERGVGLLRRVLPERFVETAHDVLRVDLVPQAGQEVDVFLGRARQIENGEPHDVADIEEKLLKAAALPGNGRVWFVIFTGLAAAD